MFGDESITKAQHTADLLVSDLSEAFHGLRTGPEGNTRMTVAMHHYILDCLNAAKSLRFKLVELGD